MTWRFLEDLFRKAGWNKLRAVPAFQLPCCRNCAALVPACDSPWIDFREVISDTFLSEPNVLPMGDSSWLLRRKRVPVDV